jgi:hypothetical protein
MRGHSEENLTRRVTRQPQLRTDCEFLEMAVLGFVRSIFGGFLNFPLGLDSVVFLKTAILRGVTIDPVCRKCGILSPPKFELEFLDCLARSLVTIPTALGWNLSGFSVL